MQPWLEDRYGNPSNRDYELAWDAAEAVEDARSAVANHINARSNEIIFTSGATEALNIAVKGFIGFHCWERKRIVTSSTEHDAVLAPCLQLAKVTGVEVHVLPVTERGHIDLAQLETAIRSDRQVLVAIMAVNNEIGTIHPIRRIADIAHAAGALVLCDLAQAVGKMLVGVRADNIDLAAFSAHKMYGPKGVGALFIRGGEPQIELEPLIVGGGHERGLRGGTLNVPGIVGFGEACRLAAARIEMDVQRMQRLRDKLEAALLAELPDTWVNGDTTHRICNTSNMGFKGVDARTLIRDMHDIAVSTRSACSSANSGPSHVLKALGLSDEDAYSCIRFSLGRFTIDEEIDYTIDKVITSVQKLRRRI